MAEYEVYPLYGKDKPNCFGMKLILGTPKMINNIKSFRLYFDGLRRSMLIVDWKTRKYKLYMNGIQYCWRRFTKDEWCNLFRFSSPCEDWELSSKGKIEDAYNFDNPIDFKTLDMTRFNTKN